MIFRLVIFFLVPLFSLHSQTYVLNPYKEKQHELPALPLTPEQEETWLKSFYQNVPLIFPLDASSIQDAEDRSLKEKINQTEQYYLELETLKASELAEECLNLLQQSLPYPSFLEDVQKLIAVKVMISETKEQIPGEALFFEDNPSFLLKISIGLQGRLKEKKVNELDLKKSDLPSSFQRILIFGQEKHLPLKLHEGNYLIHLLTSQDLEAYQVHLTHQKKSFKKLWKRSLWLNHSPQTLKKYLELTKPIGLPDGGITVIIRNAQNQPTPLVVAPPLKTKVTQNLWNEDRSLESTEKPLWKSPWFWLATGVVVGAASYLMYDSTRKKVAVTP